MSHKTDVVLRLIASGAAVRLRHITDSLQDHELFDRSRSRRYREVDHALQALRKSKRAEYDTKTGWSAVEPTK